jgi:hypothetical protein
MWNFLLISLLFIAIKAGAATEAPPFFCSVSGNNFAERSANWARLRARSAQSPLPAGCLDSLAKRIVIDGESEGNEDSIQFIARSYQNPAFSNAQRAAFLEILLIMQQSWLLQNVPILLDKPGSESAMLAGGGLAIAAFLAFRYSPFTASVQSRVVRESSMIYFRMSTYLAGRLGITGGSGALETVGSQLRREQRARLAESTRSEHTQSLSNRPSPAEISGLRELSLPTDYGDKEFLIDLASLTGNVGTGLIVGIGMERALRTTAANSLRSALPRFFARGLNPVGVGLILGTTFGYLVDFKIEDWMRENSLALNERQISSAINAIRESEPELRGERTALAIQYAIFYFINAGAEYRWEQAREIHSYQKNRICRPIDYRSSNMPEIASWPQRYLSPAAWNGWPERAHNNFLRQMYTRSDLARESNLQLRIKLENWLSEIKNSSGHIWLNWYDHIARELLRLHDHWANPEELEAYTEMLWSDTLRTSRDFDLRTTEGQLRARVVSQNWGCVAR